MEDCGVNGPILESRSLEEGFYYCTRNEKIRSCVLHLARGDLHAVARDERWAGRLDERKSGLIVIAEDISCVAGHN